MQRSKLATTLSITKIFGKLDAKGLDEVSKACQILTYHKKDIIIEAGIRLSGIYLVHSGLVNAYYNNDASQQIISAIIQPGGCIGLSALVRSELPATCCMALCTSRLLYISTETFDSLYQRYPAIGYGVMAAYQEQARWLLNHILCVKARTIEERLATWLLKQPKLQEPTINKSVPIVEITTTKTELALQLGVKIQTLSRVFSTMKESDIINIYGKRIEILDRARLASYINTP